MNRASDTDDEADQGKNRGETEMFDEVMEVGVARLPCSRNRSEGHAHEGGGADGKGPEGDGMCLRSPPIFQMSCSWWQA
jgi:hypothetical protein